MNEFLRERIQRRLETLSDERLYQVLDYVEFLESKYAQRQPAGTNVFTRFVEGVEDTLRAGRVSASTIAETTTLLSRAVGVLNGAVAAGKSVATDVVGAAARAAESGAGAPHTPSGFNSSGPRAPATPPPDTGDGPEDSGGADRPTPL